MFYRHATHAASVSVTCLETLWFCVNLGVALAPSLKTEGCHQKTLGPHTLVSAWGTHGTVDGVFLAMGLSLMTIACLLQCELCNFTVEHWR